MHRQPAFSCHTAAAASAALGQMLPTTHQPCGVHQTPHLVLLLLLLLLVLLLLRLLPAACLQPWQQQSCRVPQPAHLLSLPLTQPGGWP